MLLKNSDNRDIDEILEILANRGRRRIIELLTKKPCYVSEISYTLRMAPKVVLEHLEKLERAGIVKSFEDGRRRYYYIDKSLNISITISPHRFRVDSVESSRNIGEIFSAFRDITEKFSSDPVNVFERLSKIEKMFMEVQRELSERIDSLIDRMIVKIEEMTAEDIERIVLYALIKGAKMPEEISDLFNIEKNRVMLALRNLESKGIVERVKDNDLEYYRLRIGGEIK